MPSASHTKRLSRIRRRATQEVQRAFEVGQISARRADQLLYLEPQEQIARLNRLLADREEAKRRSRIAARVIKSYVERGCRDLVALRGDLKSALASVTVKTHA